MGLLSVGKQVEECICLLQPIKTQSNFKLARLHTNEHPVAKTGGLREEREVEC
jgi:hypothetical protein